MFPNTSSRTSFVRLAAFAATLTLVTTMFAQTETVINNFAGANGAVPWSGLIFDQAGNLYGTTSAGGAHNAGTVYELTPTSSGWQETVLYSFRGKDDGASPFPNLVFDSAGNLYGAAFAGGPKYRSGCTQNGCGLVYKLSPSAGGGPWTETVLHTFTGGKNGIGPLCTLIFDAQGNLYGTTRNGGLRNADASGEGLVFELSPTGTSWKEKVLHTFTGKDDGSIPYSGLISDAAGNLYGTTIIGGNLSDCQGSGCGVVYQLSPNTDGTWTYTVLHTFTESDGSGPYGPLIFDPSGNLYGTTQGGGANLYYGTVFMLSPNGATWDLTTLHSFNSTDGQWPQNSLLRDANGNLFGTTAQGGAGQAGGLVFELSPQSGGGWTETVLTDFSLNFFGGAYPLSNLIADSAGNLYGTAEFYGTGNEGIVYEISF